MGLFNKDKNSKSTEGQLPSANPTGDELAEMEAAAALSPENVRQELASLDRQEILKRAVDAGRIVVHGSEVSGEVPLITPGMERPAEGNVATDDESDQHDVDSHPVAA